MINFIKGVLISIGKILPGISGSMIAISLGVYKKMLENISNIFNFNKIELRFIIKFL